MVKYDLNPQLIIYCSSQGVHSLKKSYQLYLMQENNVNVFTNDVGGALVLKYLIPECINPSRS